MATAIPLEHAPAANVASATEIQLTVLDNMRLALYPQEVARAGEHNSAIFRIVKQPQTLDALPCRAEIKTADGGKFYVLVQDGSFILTDDITAHGVGTLQLVYSDGTVTHKTLLAQYYVSPSIYAVDPSDPQYQDGLAQLTNAAFTDAQTQGTTLIFRNLAGQQVDAVVFPGAGLDEEAANRLYLRLEGGIMSGPIMAPAQTQPVTQQLINREFAEARFISVDGGSIVGPINAIYDTSNPAPGNLVTRQYTEATFLKQSGGQVSGVLFMSAGMPFISAMGSGSNPMLCIGSNDSGFWRSASNVVFEVGRAVVAIYGATGTTFYTPLLLANAPTQANEVITKAYADTLRAPSMLVAIGSTMSISSAFQSITSLPYPIPRGGNSRVLVTLAGGLRLGTAGQIAIVQVRCGPSDIVQNTFAYSVLDGANVETSGVNLSIPVDVTGTAPVINVEIRALGGPPPVISLIGGPGESERTTVTIADLGPR